VFKIEPDLTTLGKIIGGGLPVGAYGGRREIMQRVAPGGPVYQAGTLSGNPLAMRAGTETLKVLAEPGFYDELNRKAARLIEGLRSAVDDSGLPAQITSVGSLLTLFFTKQRVRDYAGAKKSDTSRFAAFFSEMLDREIFLPPSQFEALFVSAAHTEADIDRTVAACRETFKSLLAAAPAV
jgi:glutamate-1-semialdehyde 2,1-aminomutase